jgi:hypothetical protein
MDEAIAEIRKELAAIAEIINRFLAANKLPSTTRRNT